MPRGSRWLEVAKALAGGTFVGQDARNGERLVVSEGPSAWSVAGFHSVVSMPFRMPWKLGRGIDEWGQGSRYSGAIGARGHRRG